MSSVDLKSDVRTRPQPGNSLVRLMGHDLRNKLGVMQNSVYYLRMKMGQPSDKVLKHIDILLREISISNRVVIDLMDLVAPKEPQLALLDLNAMLRAALERASLPQGVELMLRLADELPLALGDAEQIAHALDNILSYESNILSEGDKLWVVSWCNRHVCLEFIASGSGLSEEELANLMAPTGAPGQHGASYVGLYVARQLVELNGGALEVKSQQGTGTRFSVTLQAS